MIPYYEWILPLLGAAAEEGGGVGHPSFPAVFIRDLLLMLAGGLLAGLACRRAGLPSLVGYLLVGALLGPGMLRFVGVEDPHQVEQLAELGVFFLLFSIGLEFSLEELARSLRSLLIGGFAQMALVALPATGLLLLIGQPPATATLLGLAIAFSSTVLVFKALAEWGQTSTEGGRSAISILLFQDAALVPLLLAVPLLTGKSQGVPWGEIGQSAAASVGLIVGVVVLRYLLARFVVPRLAAVRSAEFVMLLALVTIGATTYACRSVGLPPAVGAFAAGLILGGNRWSAQIDALVLPFRETFAAIFFVSLGLLLTPLSALQTPLATFGGLGLLILLKMLAGTLALRLLGIPWRTAAGLGVGLAHVGEFAFVLVLAAAQTGLVTNEVKSQLLNVAVISLVLSPILLRWGLRFGVTETSKETAGHHPATPVNAAVVIGAGPIGCQVAARLETLGRDVCLVDRSPLNLYQFAQQGFRTVSGDATDSAVLEHAGADRAELVVICIPDDGIALAVVKLLRVMNGTALLVVRCRYRANEYPLRHAGANLVVSEENQASLELLRHVDRLLQPREAEPHPTRPGAPRAT